MKKHLTLALFLTLQAALSFSQDTFSIVAVDSLTGEVGSAGASCISATNLKTYCWLRTLPAVADGERLTVEGRGLFLLRLVSKNGQTGVRKVMVK